MAAGRAATTAPARRVISAVASRTDTPGATPLRWFGAAVGIGLGALAYGSLIERQWFALRRASAPVLDPGAAPLRVLHVSDLHVLPSHHRKQRWISGLARLRPDVVVCTGDMISSEDSIDAVLTALGGLLDIPGAFVFGNNDFYAPEPKSPHRYFTRRTHVRREVDLPWRELGVALQRRSWLDLTDTRARLDIGGRTVAFGGVDDAHTGRDRYDLIAGPADADAVVRIGVTHSPEPRLLDAFAHDGYDVVLAGHTHGGQVRLPGIGALVTNCGIDRTRARGLSRWGAHLWVHVSAGLGNSPFMPVRFFCRPEATLLTLSARPQ